MFVDAREVPGGTEIGTDLCIVGAGAAGITLAREFIGLPVRVCLLESGGMSFDPATQALCGGDNVGLEYYPLDVCRLRYFGGSTNAWGGWCRPLDSIDFQTRPWVDDSGWPISYDDLAPYYSEAHGICQIIGPEYDPQRSVERLGDRYAKTLPTDGTRIETTMYTFSPPTRFGRVYAREIQNAANVSCLLNANSVNIETNHDGTVATRVEVACLSGKRFLVSSKIFVLAAGGIENARLLLLSNRIMAQGLGNQHDVVGRYFMEHTHTERRLLTIRQQAPLDLYGMDFVHRRLSARLSLTPLAQERDKLLQYSANIRPVYVGEDNKGWQAFRYLYEVLYPKWRVDPIFRTPPYEPKRFRLSHATRMMMHSHWVAVAALAHTFRIKRLVRCFILESKSEQAPNRDSQIRLTSKRDELGCNRVELNWRMLPLDRETVCRAEDFIDRELQRLNIGKLEPRPPEEVDAWPPSLRGGWHQLGTTRMHPNPKKGVVDAHCRVHGTSNLFVAGGSVFPTSGTATPTLTIVALTLRLGAHLRNTAFAAGSSPIPASSLVPDRFQKAEERDASDVAAK